MRRYLGLIVMLMVAARGAATDGAAILNSSISVEDIHLSAARTGESSNLRLRILNDSLGPLVLLRVDSTASQSARIMARVGTSEWTEVGSITIPSDSTLDLGSSHIRIVFENLESELSPNATVPVVLRFNRGSLNVVAHVMSP